MIRIIRKNARGAIILIYRHGTLAGFLIIAENNLPAARESHKHINIKASLIALLLVFPYAWTPMFLTWVANIVCEYFIGRYLDTKLGKKDRDVISLAHKKASKRFSKEFKSKLIRK